MSSTRSPIQAELTDEELEAAQGGTPVGITLDVEPNDTIQNARASRPNPPSGRTREGFLDIRGVGDAGNVRR